MTIWRRTAASAALLLLVGCTTPLGTDTPVNQLDPTSQPVQVVFTAAVTGKAQVRWSDGIQTHSQLLTGDNLESDWKSTVDSYRYVTAMTVTPIGKGSKATCLITVRFDGDDDSSWTTFDDKSTSPTKAAVCIQTGEADDDQPPAGAKTVNILGASNLGGGSYRAVTPAGNVDVENVKGGEPDQREFTTLGRVSAVIVSTRAGDTVSCRIRDGHIGDLDTDTYEMNSADGLGAIATCHGNVTR